MNITNLPHEPMLDADGGPNDSWRVFYSQLVSQLQKFLGDEKYIMPAPDTTTIGLLNVDKNKGGILYNSDSEAGQINTDGKFKNLSTYENLSPSEISAIPTGQRDGRFIRDTTSGDLKVGINDIFKTVTLT